MVLGEAVWDKKKEGKVTEGLRGGLRESEDKSREGTSREKWGLYAQYAVSIRKAENSSLSLGKFEEGNVPRYSEGHSVRKKKEGEVVGPKTWAEVKNIMQSSQVFGKHAIQEPKGAAD